MAYIRERNQLLTGVQDRSPWSGKTDFQYDFVMVYGTDADMPRRIREYRDQGYVVHLMTGSAWGEYQDYLDGRWDGVSHWDESQQDRYGKPILHGVNVPYLCPSLSFAEYLTQSLYPAVDAGVEAIHLEEPEFWDEGGYSQGFQREYQAYYGESWQAPHLSPENRHKCAALKVYLYRRLVEKVSSQIKQYAAAQGKTLHFYVPTHSLLNYTQWKILSPEATLLDVDTVDGYIAQVWTGTSRCGNVYMGRYDERTFETAFLEYGVMQELTRGTGRRMWFLHDPIEDNPEHSWTDFRKNYLMTVAASLLHPHVHHYEVITWPSRVMNGVYPKKGRWGSGLLPGESLENAKPIPESYASLLSGMVQTLGDMDQTDFSFDSVLPRIGLFMADSALYQRTFPDSVSHTIGGVHALNEAFLDLLRRQKSGEDTRDASYALMANIDMDERLYHDYAASAPFPHFFGMAMPLVKCGMPLRPVQLENVTRYAAYLADYDTLILSYEYMKPLDAKVHEALRDWVLSGGTLIYVGDGSDPYHQVSAWWNQPPYAYENPAQHLFEVLGITPGTAESVHPVGKGRAAIYPLSPGRITLSRENAEKWRSFVHALAAPDFVPRHYFSMRRGPYRIAAVMQESVSQEALTLRGRFADMLDPDFPLIREKVLNPGENALLFDLDAIVQQPVRIIGTSARIFSLDQTDTGYQIRCKAAEGIPVRMRLKLPQIVHAADGQDAKGRTLPVLCQWDGESSTVLLSFPSTNEQTVLTLYT